MSSLWNKLVPIRLCPIRTIELGIFIFVSSFRCCFPQSFSIGRECLFHFFAQISIQSSKVRAWQRAILLANVLVFVCACNPILPPADLVIINGKEPESLDPAIINGQAEGRIVSSLFEGLLRYNSESGLPEAGLAHSWQILSGGREYRFHLRQNLHWSDGTAITSADLIYSWKRILEPKTACEYASILYPIQNAAAFNQGEISDFKSVGIHQKDRFEIQILLEHPTPYFLDLCCFPNLAIVPQHAIEKHKDRWITRPDLPVSGAYRLALWRLNDRIRLIRNPHYWDRPSVASKVIDILPTSNANTALNLYETGEVDIVWDKELIPTELIPILRHRPDFHVNDFFGTYFLRFNTTQKPFDNVLVRKALTMAIDKHRLTKRITGAGESIAEHFVPSGIADYDSPSGLSFDPQNARNLLTKAGYEKGFGFPPIDYLFNSSSLNEQIAVEIQSMWKEHLGIETRLRQLEWKSYLQDQTELRYGVSRSSWLGDFLDPITFLDVFTAVNGNNRTGWHSPRYDHLLAQSRLLHQADRMEILRQAEAILIEACPIIPLYFYVSMAYYDPKKIAGIFPNLRSEHPLRSIHRIENPH